VVNGVGGVQNGSIVIDVQESVYRQIITGLSVASGYDIYWVLDDGTFPITIDSSPQINLRTSDNLANVTTPITQITGATIASTANAAVDAVDVFAFTINDDPLASGQDNSPTNVTRIWIRNSGSTASWTNSIAGVTLTGNTLGNIPILDTRISTDSIVIDIDPNNLVIPVISIAPAIIKIPKR